MIDATAAAEIREIRHRMFERRLHALIAGIVLLVVALTLGVIIAVDPASSLVQGIDDRWLRWMVSSRTPFWTRVAKDVSAIGAVKVTLPLRLLVSAVLAWHRRW
ncbi:MAG TPA: hypothetical protein VNB52_10445, partial [Ilumatobacteraceae bacterium]|nr:hypothetical protein [Ilumatobacteraceae bacterium]